MAVSYAPTSRASCKGCRITIAEASVRISIEVRSRFHDGMDLQHYCLGCGRRKTSLDELEGLRTLRWKDQETVISKLGGNPSSVLDYAKQEATALHWADYDALVSACKPKQIKDMVLHNAEGAVLQESVKTLEYAHIAADGVRHGRLVACDRCGNRSLFPHPGGVEAKCVGWFSASVRCTNSMRGARAGDLRDGTKWQLPPDMAKKKGAKELLDGGSLATGHVEVSGAASSAAPTAKRKKGDLASASSPSSSSSSASAMGMALPRAPIPSSSHLRHVDATACSRPEVAFDAKVHVTHSESLAWNVNLNFVDMAKNRNSFYTLQGIKNGTTAAVDANKGA